TPLCYSSIKMPNGQDLIFIQDKDSSDDIFGNIGNNVETTIVVKQFWNEYEKKCDRVNIFKTGKKTNPKPIGIKSSSENDFNECKNKLYQSDADLYACYDREYDRLIKEMDEFINTKAYETKLSKINKNEIIYNQNQWIENNNGMADIEGIYNQMTLGVTGICITLEEKINRALVRKAWLVNIFDGIQTKNSIFE
ncbi:MAG: hypothetical protein ACLR52_01420, partial [Veillonella atypica]